VPDFRERFGVGEAPESFGRRSSSYWNPGEKVRFFDGDEFLEDADGVEGSGRSTSLGPCRVRITVGSHSTTFDTRRRYFPIFQRMVEGMQFY